MVFFFYVLLMVAMLVFFNRLFSIEQVLLLKFSVSCFSPNSRVRGINITVILA